MKEFVSSFNFQLLRPHVDVGPAKREKTLLQWKFISGLWPQLGNIMWPSRLEIALVLAQVAFGLFPLTGVKELLACIISKDEIE